MTDRSGRAIVTGLLAVVLLAGCRALPALPDSGAAAGPEESTATTPAGPGPPTAETGTVVDVAAALAQLEALPQASESAAAYDRDSYGERWSDIDQNNCNQRDDRLVMDGLPGTLVVAPQGNCDHDVLAGQWIDPYTGELLVATDLKDQTQAQAITIDHIVPLAEAHASGAYGWTDEQREVYANTLDLLRVVAGNVNSAKGDQDPAEWLPGPAALCWYAAAWIAIKTAWVLTADPAEVQALRATLGGC